MIDFLRQQFEKIAIPLTERQVQQWNTYFEMLTEKNKVMNLTAITEFNEVVIKHFVDSVLVLKTGYIPKGCLHVIDVGTGAGFPGIPLKITCPELKVTLLDSLNKRVQFLKEVVSELALENVKCLHGRAEDFGHDSAYREKFDVCVSRAVANLSTLSEYCVPFVKVGGVFIAYKASEIDEELNKSKSAVKKLHCQIKDVVKINLEDLDGSIYERNFIVIGKDDKLNQRYPRKAGIPSRNPLQ